MKNASPELIEFLTTATSFFEADLYTFHLTNGEVLRFSSFDRSITIGENDYQMTGLLFKRGEIHSSIGMEVDELTVSVYAHRDNAQAAIDGVPFSEFARKGGLDGALMRLEYLIMPTPGDVSLGAVTRFFGRVGNVEPGRTETIISVQSLPVLLNVQMPRNLFQPGCLHTLYDSGCGLNKNSFEASGTVQAGSTTTIINTDIPGAAGYFDLGTIEFQSGTLAGHKRTVRSYAGGTFLISLPLITAPLTSVTIKAWPGCNKMQATCQNKFNNLPNFRGFPYIPVPETAA